METTIMYHSSADLGMLALVYVNAIERTTQIVTSLVIYRRPESNAGEPQFSDPNCLSETAL